MNRFLFRALLLAAPLAFSGAARAETPAPDSISDSTLSSSKTPAFAPSQLFSPSQISLQTLPNGVRGIVKAASGSDLVNIQVWLRGGSRVETSRESGVAHLVEILALRGSKAYPAASGGDEESGPTAAIRAMGGDAGSLTSRDSTFYSATVAAPYAARALQILADAVLRPDLSLSAVEDARLQASDDISRRSFDAVASASDLAYATAYAKHPYRHPAQGSAASVTALSQSAVRRFYQANYVGSNITVVMVGQIAAPTAQNLIAQNFRAASAAKPAPFKSVAELPFKGDVVARRKTVAREVIDLAWRSPGINVPEDCVALDMLLALWREGLDANLRRILLRDGEKGPNVPLVGSYDVDFLTQRDPGLFMVVLIDPQDREGAVDAVLAEVKRVRENGISKDELERAKAGLRQQYIEQAQNVSGQAGSFGFYGTIASHRFAVEYLDRCAKVTAADVQRVAIKYLSDKKYLRAEIAPLPRPRPEDDSQGPVITARLESRRLETQNLSAKGLR